MSNVERVGISVETDLLAGFDALIKKRGYQTRSEAIRDLIRTELSQEKLNNPLANAIAVIYLVYDHHSSQLAGKLVQMQHSHLLKTVSSMHIHLTHHDCLEIVVMRGPVGEIQRVAESIIALKGVELGKVNLISVEGEDESGHHHH
jgi:CopG family transcriptional regulator, nickel-responsive regulator